MSATASNLLRFLVARAAIIAMAAGLNFLVDPLQLFRPARLFAAMYSPDTRMQDAGLIRSQEFDTVLMGPRSPSISGKATSTGSLAADR